MAEGTEQKILDAALKLFAKKGYDAATTRAIAEESGYTEMTLFQKFGTKKNLFDQVMIRSNKQVREKSLEELLAVQEYKNTREFLEAYVRNLARFSFDNFEFFHLTVTEESKVGENIMESTAEALGYYMEKNMPNKRVDYKTFGYAISTFIYSLNNDKYHKRTATFANYEESMGKLVDILCCMVDD